MDVPKIDPGNKRFKDGFIIGFVLMGIITVILHYTFKAPSKKESDCPVVTYQNNATGEVKGFNSCESVPEGWSKPASPLSGLQLARPAFASGKAIGCGEGVVYVPSEDGAYVVEFLLNLENYKVGQDIQEVFTKDSPLLIKSKVLYFKNNDGARYVQNQCTDVGDPTRLSPDSEYGLNSFVVEVKTVGREVKKSPVDCRGYGAQIRIISGQVEDGEKNLIVLPEIDMPNLQFGFCIG